MKYFDVTNPSKIVTILNDDTSFIHLSDGNMIKKDKFEQKYQPVLYDKPINEQKISQPIMNNDTIDPASFFASSGVVSVLPDVKKLDTSKLSDIKQDSEIIRNGVGRTTQQNNSNDSIIKQDMVMVEIEQLYDNEKLAFGETEANNRRLKRIAEHQGLLKPKPTQAPVNTVTQETNTYQQQPQVDPSELMFKSFKRNFEININVNFRDKIANPDFVKMMMENIEGDIISYYKKIIMQNIMQNIKTIENEVEHSIKYAIYGEDIIEDEIEIIPQNIPDGIILNSTKSTNVIDTIIDDGGITNIPVKTDIVDNKEIILVKGKMRSGKQLYKYVDENDNIKEMLPENAEKKGYKPYIEIE